MVYLVLKELAPLSEQDHIIIVIASLTKDMNDKNEVYRANAIRVLSRIIEVRKRAVLCGAFFRLNRKRLVKILKNKKTTISRHRCLLKSNDT
jgi:hypothetical protein